MSLEPHRGGIWLRFTRLIYPFEQIFILIFNIVLMQQFNVFFLKWFYPVMSFLILYIMNYSIQVRFRAGEGAVPLLPCKTTTDPMIFINEP